MRQVTGLALAAKLARWLPGATVEELAKLARRKDDPDRNSAAEDAIYLRWAELDPEGAIHFATANGHAAPAWWAWSQVDPDKALAAAAKNPRSVELELVLRGIAQNDPEKARLLGEKYPAAFHSASVQEALASKLAHDDPGAATEIAYRAGSFTTRRLVSDWARTDPEAALDWARSVGTSDDQKQLVDLVFHEWAASHPETVAAAIDRLPPGRLRIDMMKNEALRRFQTDPQAALDYAANVQNAPRLTLMDTILQRLATTDPQSARSALAQLEKSDWENSGQLRSTLRTLGESAGADTMAWLRGPEAAAGVSAAPDVERVVFNGWLSQFPETAIAWLAGQPAESRPKGAVVSVALALEAIGPSRWHGRSKIRRKPSHGPASSPRGRSIRRLWKNWRQRLRRPNGIRRPSGGISRG